MQRTSRSSSPALRPAALLTLGSQSVRAPMGGVARGCLAMLGLVYLLPEIGPAPAQAQMWWNDTPYYTRQRPPAVKPRLPRQADPYAPKRSGRAAGETVSEKVPASSGPLMAIVSLGAQRVTIYDSTGPIMRAPISSGTAGHRTPTGVFSIIQKNRFHRSNIYSGAPMPYMQRITWSGIALHAGVLPGYPASHGCIRLPYPTAAKLFAMSKMGMRVIVAPHEPTASAFSHAALPEPVMVAAPSGPADSRAEGGAASSPVRVAAAEGGDTAPVVTRFLNPMQNAVLERTRSRARVVEATRADKELLEASLRASAEANAASAALRSAQAMVEQLRSRSGAATGDARAQFDEQLAEAEKNLTVVAEVERVKSKAAYAAASASREAEEAKAAAEDAVKVSDRGTEPIAVFISRKEGKVLVRQGMVPLFEAPVTFKEPNRPLGTHVYQAMAGDNSTGRVAWTVVTVPETISTGTALENRAPVRRGERVPTQLNSGLPSDAKSALERVEMPDDIKRRIAERLWINGSIVISDHGLGNETGKGTDFIVLTQ